MKALRPTGGLMLRQDGSSLPWSGKGEMLTQVERISKKIILAAGLRPELTFTPFGRHGGATESKSSGLTELQLMEKGQWSSTAAMGNHLHDDDEGKQGSANKAHQAAGQKRQAGGQKVNVCRNETAGLVGMKNRERDKCLKTLERVKGIEPSHSAWKSPKFDNVFKSRSDISQLSGRLRSLRNFLFVGMAVANPMRVLFTSFMDRPFTGAP